MAITGRASADQPVGTVTPAPIIMCGADRAGVFESMRPALASMSGRAASIIVATVVMIAAIIKIGAI